MTELEFKSLATQGYNRIPLIAEAFADLETPLSLYLKLAQSHPVPIAKADAANWIEQQLDPGLAIGVTRVILHSIAFQYFPGPAQARIRAHIAAVGAAATEEAPVAWLRFEWLSGEPSASLRLRTWPGEERQLAWAHPHGSDVSWL